MRKFIFLIAVFVGLIHLFSIAQSVPKIDAYKVESDGYFTNISVSDFGIIATDNYASKIYLIQNGQLNVLFSAAGCGRFYSLSPDKKKIGFKYITDDGKQTPAILNILTQKMTPLNAPVNLCGQVSFSNNGKVAFTIGNILYIKNETSEQAVDLRTYSNIVPISPGGNFAVYNNENDRLFLLDLNTGQSTQITDNATGYIYPAWSPDGKKIVFSSISGKLYVFDKNENITYFIDSGTNPSWSENSDFITYTKTLTNNLSFSGSDIFISGYQGTGLKNITNTPEINEMGAVFDSTNIIFHTYNKREIYKALLNSDKTAFSNTTLIFDHYENFLINHYNILKATKAETRVPGIVPYVNQVYDTPEWHYGYGSCAPTTAIMAVAYYNKLPKWPTQTSNGIGTHNSDYGSYVADRYRLNEYYYQDISATGGGEDSWGGYGYMWTGSYSPHSHMRQYMENHYLTSVQEDADNWAKATTQINNGNPFPVCNLLTTAGHLTLGIGYIQGQHTMIFNDPYGDKNHSSWPNWYGQDSYYDWPGYNNGYQNLNTVAWTVTAEGSEIAYNDTIIDDIFYNHGFYMNNSQNTSTQRYFHDQNAGYNNHFWFTGSVNTTADICYVTWTPNIAQTGIYEVFAYLPGGTNANAQNALYKIYYNGGQSLVVINQNQYSGQWVSLGTYSFLQGQSGYVYLGDSTGVASENLAWDAMKFSKVGSTDHTAPATNISSPENWKTEDFTASFSDQDNAGGSGIEKSYYQVLDYDGSYWRANATNGFFADNFDILNSGIWSTPANGGTWSVVNGFLKQVDSTITNTNIYASLNQNLSDRSLYHFSARIESEPYSTTQRRFGFHFFCDTGSTLNRSNSYFVFFRQETSKLEFYKVENNVSTQVKVVDNIVTNIGQLYDYKTIYDRITGKISVYRDDIFLSSWTDSSPLTTSGNYISFRTGNCKVSVSELKVFRSRNSSVNVTLGTANTDIRFQNSNPLIPSAKIKSIVADSTGNLSSVAYHDLNVDWTAPADVVVSDGLIGDIDTISNIAEISANWTASTDPNSDIYRYLYAVGTSPGSSEIINWTDNGTATSFTQTSVTLQNGLHYYVSVYAENNAGLISNTTISDGIYILNLPIAGFVSSSQNVCQGDTIYYVNTSTNASSYQWLFEGGMPSVSTIENPIVEYSSDGIFNVELIAAGQGMSDTIIQNALITVNSQTQALFNTNVIIGTAPLLILFNNTSTHSDGFIWHFGEGNPVTDINPYHIYNNAGDYTIMLLSLNSHCGNDTAFLTIHVDPFVGIEEIGLNNNFTIYSNSSTLQTHIEYEIAEAGKVRLKVYDILGKDLYTLVNADQTAGKYNLQVHNIDFPSGIYYCKLEVMNKTSQWQFTKQMRIVK